MTERKIVIPGELIVEGDDYLPGDGTEKRDNGIFALKFGLAEESNKLVKIIPLTGAYQPRRGNVVIGRVEMLTFNGWVINIGAADNAFLPLTEVPRFVNKNDLESVMKVGDMVIAKIWNMNARGIDLSIKSRGLGKVEEGLIIKINPHKVPRVIGKEGSMINLIKDETGCNVNVGQNGMVLIKGDTIEQELKAKEVIKFITEKSLTDGLTEEVKKYLEEKK